MEQEIKNALGLGNPELVIESKPAIYSNLDLFPLPAEVAGTIMVSHTTV